jgi:hypothetical protein
VGSTGAFAAQTSRRRTGQGAFRFGDGEPKRAVLDVDSGQRFGLDIGAGDLHRRIGGPAERGEQADRGNYVGVARMTAQPDERCKVA